MDIGIYVNLTTGAMPVTELARALEDRGLESLFVSEHTHTPVATEPDGYHTAEIIEATRDVPAPFVLLAAAAAVTKRLRIGTSVCLPGQHDPLVFAKQVATLDQISDGRVVLGCGYGWNKAEMLNHGVDPQLRRSNFREKLAATKALWTQDTAECRGRFVSFSESWSLPKPVQRRGPTVLIGAPARERTFQDIVELADGWLPAARFTDELLGEELLQFERAIEEAGRSRSDFLVTMLDSRATLTDYDLAEFPQRCVTSDRLRHWSDMGINRVVIGVPVHHRAAAMPLLDHVADLANAITV